MAIPDAWGLIHAERKALLADLEGLTAEQWATPSMCEGWTVREVLGHMVATSRMTTPRFLSHLASSGFRFHAMSAKDVAAETAGPPADTLARFRSTIDATTKPPGPLDTMVGEALVHSEDIRRPLGLSHTYPPAMVTGSADFFKKSNLLLGGKRRIDGLTLRATDLDWSTGSGPEVAGPGVSLVLVIAGRKPPLDDLSGEGLATLRSRT
jgi:uncharacterized protein (TIGR03083 family)